MERVIFLQNVGKLCFDLWSREEVCVEIFRELTSWSTLEHQVTFYEFYHRIPSQVV